MSIPEKEFFTLDEIAERWACIGFGESSFLNLARKDLLVFSVYKREIGSHKKVTETPDSIITKETKTISFVAEGYSTNGVRYLRAEDARRILEAEPSEQINVPGLYSLPSRAKECGVAQGGLYFTAKDLGISLSERTRFESAHGYNSLWSRLYRWWVWAKEEQNRAVIAWLGVGLASIASAVWAVLLFVYECK